MLLNFVKFHVMHYDNLKRNYVSVKSLRDFNKNFHAGGIISKIICCIGPRNIV